MDLWIRTQNKEQFTSRMLRIFCDYYKENEYRIVAHTYDEIILLGTYKTKERAMKILDEIDERIAMLNTLNLVKNELMLSAFKNAFSEDKIKGLCYPYQMPKE